MGLIIYVLRFFLIAAVDPEAWDGRMRGYECAYRVAEVPLTSTPFSPNSDDYAPPLVYISILISALINPTFLGYVALAFLKPMLRTARVLKFALLLMIPFCWVVFYCLEVYPREGHIFWVIGMLLVLFSGSKQVPTPGLRDYRTS